MHAPATAEAALPRISFAALAASPSLAARFSRRFLLEACVFPFLDEAGRPALACARPPDDSVLQAARIVTGAEPVCFVAARDDIAALLAGQPGETEAPAAPGPRGEDDIDSLRDLASGAPVVRAVTGLLERAAELRATDLHIEVFRTGLAVRLRVDGLMRAIPAPPAELGPGIVSRIKILAGLDIAQRRLPQDGAARLRIAGQETDLRVATMPVAHGESAVIRLLPRDRALLDLARVGMNKRDEATMRALLAMPYGLIVITGPTGSGKTTTLAGALTILNEPHRKILTVEDPIEYDLPGVNQSQVKLATGLTFATAIRAFVRQDPDVIMVGEVRDGETADTAIQAALTGHLVLTTLHTETAAAAVPRLLDLGVEGFLLQSTVRGVVAQRLIRLLCGHCKRAVRVSPEMRAADPRCEAAGLRDGEMVCEPAGCERCGGSGFRGRRGIFEILEVTPAVRAAMAKGSDTAGLEAAAKAQGMTTMADDALAHVRAGTTSLAEMLRVTAPR